MPTQADTTSSQEVVPRYCTAGIGTNASSFTSFASQPEAVNQNQVPQPCSIGPSTRRAYDGVCHVQQRMIKEVKPEPKPRDQTTTTSWHPSPRIYPGLQPGPEPLDRFLGQQSKFMLRFRRSFLKYPALVLPQRLYLFDLISSVQVNVVVNAIVADCASDTAGASAQLYLRNYYLNADSRANLTVYTNVGHLPALGLPCNPAQFHVPMYSRILSDAAPSLNFSPLTVTDSWVRSANVHMGARHPP
jgi:hypothetical protein